MRKTIYGFNGLRGIASIAVVFTHTAAGFTQIGGLAVNLFFVLSGYLILSGLHDARSRIEAGKSSTMSELTSFWHKRFLRIVPAYYAVIGLCMVLVLWEGGLYWPEVIYYVTYSQNFYMAYVGHWLPLGHTWTLAVEQQFYLLIAPLVLFAPAALHLSILTFIITAMGTAVIVGFMTPALDPFVVARMPFVGILLGCAGGYAALRPIGRVPSAIAAALTIAALAASLVPSSFFVQRPLLNSVNFLCQMLACTVMVTYLATHQEGQVVRALENKFLRFLGLISYSIYLVHGTFAELLKEHWVTIDFGSGPATAALNRVLIFIACSILSIAAGYLSWRFVESRFQYRRPKDFSGATKNDAVPAA